ncbi:hypothetical protein R1sor_017018 [Riccia sorocarpa]|uniref:Uncharacterized protein n=1 Tax=Riccia sorocarpa TaxID=122646 RepID=A0ABD3I9L4_9MARC
MVLYKELVDNQRGSAKLRAVKAEECDRGQQTEVGGGKGVPRRNKTVESSEEISSSADRVTVQLEEMGSKAPQKGKAKITRSQGEGTLEDRNLWRATTDKQSKALKTSREIGGQREAASKERGKQTSEITAQPAYRPPAASAAHSASTSKRKQRSRSDSEEKIGHINKQLRSRGPVHKI